MISIFSGSETMEEENIFGTFSAVELTKIHGSSLQYGIVLHLVVRTEETRREVKSGEEPGSNRGEHCSTSTTSCLAAQ